MSEAISETTIRHSERFRKVSNRYPLRVTEAYGGDLERAAADSDEKVAETVAEWERAQGLDPRDWVAIGREERAAPEALQDAGRKEGFDV